jgi:hypothetical protein
MVAALTVSGCGGHGHSSTIARTDSAAAKALASWTIAARTFNVTIQQCARQPNPLKGYWIDCTRSARRDYADATRALQTTNTGAHPACTAALGGAKTLERQMSAVLTKAWQANRAFLTASGYHGRPSLLIVDQTANRVATRDTARAESLTPAVRRACAGA